MDDIDDNLIISPATVRKHLENIYKKLQVHNKMEAVVKEENTSLSDPFPFRYSHSINELVKFKYSLIYQLKYFAFYLNNCHN